MTPAIAVLGASGLVLSRFIELYPKTVVSAPDISELDITDYEQVLGWSKQLPTGACVVLGAAHTDVGGAEKERGEKNGIVYKVNVNGPKNVAQACRESKLFLVHISTDYVFSGTEDDKGPSLENKTPRLDEENLSWYAQTKLLGEREVLDAGPATIIRISYPFRAFYKEKLDFARKTLSLYDEGKLHPMFNDQYVTPTFIDDFATLLFLVTRKQAKGIFHCASSNITTPYKFASLLLEKARGAPGVVEASSILDFRKEFPDKALHPQYGGLDCIFTKNYFGISFLKWEEQIEKLVEQLSSSK